MQITATQPASLDQQKSIKAASRTRLPLLFILIVLGAATVTFLDRPPRPLAKDVPTSVFSAERSAEYLAVIARAPHPINSPEHDAVRDYIVRTLQELGFDPQIQRTTDINERYHVPGVLDNIVCRLKGSGSAKAILLDAHYDSVPAGPGASDDGVAVASLLETARILKQQPQLKRDVIFLFSDGEERGTLGARAFVSEHPWARDTGIVLNFEARGTTGPSIMFESSDDNGWIISNFAQATSNPVANSLSYEIYKRLPAGTDFTVFRRAGYSGLNFGFIDGFANYHSPQDSVQNADHGSMQQHGDYMLALTRHFGDLESDDPRPANAVYFDVLGKFLVRYGRSAASVFLVLTIAIVVAALTLGIRAKRLRIGALLGGLASVIGGILTTVIAALLLSLPILAIKGHLFKPPIGPIPDAGWYIMAFCAIGLACGMAFYLAMSKRLGAENLGAAACIVWLALVTAVSIFLPGGTYLFLWPLLFVALAWLVIFAGRHTTGSGATTAILFVGSLPAVVIVMPMIRKIASAFAAGSTVIVSLLLGLLLSLLIGPIILETASKRWSLPVSFAAGGVGLLVAAFVISAMG